MPAQSEHPEADSSNAVWYLGIDFSTTGVSAVAWFKRTAETPVVLKSIPKYQTALLLSASGCSDCAGIKYSFGRRRFWIKPADWLTFLVISYLIGYSFMNQLLNLSRCSFFGSFRFEHDSIGWIAVSPH